MKLLHSADWHLDSPIVGRTPEQAKFLREQLLALPEKIVATAKREGCDMLLLSGDLFDGPYTKDSLDAVRNALKDAGMPVFIAPGNHDFVDHNSCYLAQTWPENVYIFTQDHMVSVEVPALNCRVYGAAFTSAYSASLLDGFQAHDDSRINIGVLHADPTQATSPYCPITQQQVQDSGLDYLALGHIHKGGSFQIGKTLCAWPGCPMGRGFDEQGEKGVLLLTLESNTVSTRLIPLDVPRFYDWEVPAGDDAATALRSVLPAVGSNDFYRITFTGECTCVNLDALQQSFSVFPYLELRDKTVPPIDLWATVGEDTLEGTYFSLLQRALVQADEEDAQSILLAAKISRKILDGQEVALP